MTYGIVSFGYKETHVWISIHNEIPTASSAPLFTNYLAKRPATNVGYITTPRLTPFIPVINNTLISALTPLYLSLTTPRLTPLYLPLTTPRLTPLYLSLTTPRLTPLYLPLTTPRLTPLYLSLTTP